MSIKILKIPQIYDIIFSVHTASVYNIDYIEFLTAKSIYALNHTFQGYDKNE